MTDEVTPLTREELEKAMVIVIDSPVLDVTKLLDENDVEGTGRPGESHSPSGCDGRLSPGIPCAVTPEGSPQIEGDTTIYHVTGCGPIRNLVPATKPVTASRASSPQSSQERRLKKRVATVRTSARIKCRIANTNSYCKNHNDIERTDRPGKSHSPSGCDGRLSPGIPCAVTPEGSPQIEGDPTIYHVTGSGPIRNLVPATKPVKASRASSPQLSQGRERKKRVATNLVPATTPVKASRASSSQSSQRRKKRVPPVRASASKKCRRTLDFTDSESEVEDEARNSDDDEGNFGVVDLKLLRYAARQLRDQIVNHEIDDDEEEGVDEHVKSEQVGQGNVIKERNAKQQRERTQGETQVSGGREGRDSAAAAPLDTDFVWSKDFSSFTGQKETYTRVPGPTFFSQDPVDIFSKIWDQGFMEMVASKTNTYAWEVFSQLSDPDMGYTFPKYLDTWNNVTVDELYRYFAILILLSFCHRSKIRDYWDTGVMGMPAFSEIISRNRFMLLTKFLRFVCKEDLSGSGYARKIEKILPVVDYCNENFAELYTPSQYLSLDESLLLWKGRLSWKQCIRSKAARFGIKSFELCEAETGYLLQYRLYSGKNSEMYSETLHGFQGHTAKVVLDIMERYLNVGHVVVMDNWYNQLHLTRYLKSLRTDVLGTLNRRRTGIPQVIKDLKPNQMERGMSVSMHCGDIALVAWRDVKLVTLISTYHRHKMVRVKRNGQAFLKPAVVQDYNRYMGGVDLKDQKLSMFLLERKRNRQWYMKVFRRLLNTSLLNAYIIYTKNAMNRVYSHREFRMKVALGLLSRYPRVSLVPPRAPKSTLRKELAVRLRLGYHFPIRTGRMNLTTREGRHKQMRCVRCTARNKRVEVTIMCSLCKVALCIGECWVDYHTKSKL